MTYISTFRLLCADCLPEKAVQILAEAREYCREVLHHGKPSHFRNCSMGFSGGQRWSHRAQ